MNGKCVNMEICEKGDLNLGIDLLDAIRNRGCRGQGTGDRKEIQN